MRIEQVWQKRGPIAIGLWPLSLLYRFALRLRRALYQLNVKSIVEIPGLPVVVVGNITVGGTGKSPLVAYLVRACQQRGLTPGIVSRGYGGQVHEQPYLVGSDDSPQTVGDEPLMLFEQTGVPLCVCTARAEAVRYLADNTDVDIVISDDGLQHLAMGRQAEIVVIDAEREFGNRWFLPAGPLRESPSRLGNVDLVVEQVAGAKFLQGDTPRFHLKLSSFVPLDGGAVGELQSLAGNTVHAIAGIGNPQRFFRSLESNGITVIEHPKVDHHVFVDEDLRFDDKLAILVTAKDAVKIRQLSPLPPNIHAVEVQLELNQALSDGIEDILENCAKQTRKPVPLRMKS